MAVPSEVLARQLAEEFAKRAEPAAVLDANARDALFHEFRTRLDAAESPRKLADAWRKNADHYIKRAVDRNRAQIGPTRITDDAVSREFNTCAEICPPPEKPDSKVSG